MTYKSAVAGINLGGGKSVIIGDNKRTDREALFRAHGRFIETLGGRYITAEDIGTSPADMEYIKLETDHVAGLLGLSGDPSPVTAYGVYVGMKAAARVRWGSDQLCGQDRLGAGGREGGVLSHAAPARGRRPYRRHRHRCREGEARRSGVRGSAGGAGRDLRPGVRTSSRPTRWAPRSTIETLPRLRVQIIAGGANNQLAEDRHGDELEQRAILYAPDYVINGGGVINVYGELHRWPVERAKKKAGEIYETLLRIFEIAQTGAHTDLPRGRPAGRAADRRGGGSGPDVDGGEAGRRVSGEAKRVPP